MEGVEAFRVRLIIFRKTIKFSGPISVLRLIHYNEPELETHVLVSSTIGPAAIWSLKLEVFVSRETPLTFFRTNYSAGKCAPS